MIYAFHGMLGGSKNGRRYMNSRLFETNKLKWRSIESKSKKENPQRNFLGKKHSKISKDKMRISNLGSKSGMAKHIGIYDSEGILIHDTYGTFSSVCEQYKLPLSALTSSVYNNGRKIYQRGRAKPEYVKYTGWFARHL